MLTVKSSLFILAAFCPWRSILTKHCQYNHHFNPVYLYISRSRQLNHFHPGYL